ncbi:MAG: inosine-5-monophosphate dehydrogenase [Ancylobacter novellus]|uniref:Inosine-5-monophosphate dehydrogenase n=1 Tax=Ancylobacter novellus TaxID=921 RepID=A0A2W5MHC6_ANCNO|nr:MAG: inosine-5-monophosphate dehydrogenase [Ancylobacter novellus]
MKVENILAAKGHSVVTIKAQDSVSSLVETLASKSIGAVVVSDGHGGVAGIITERDVVRAIASAGREALDRPVADFMTRDVVTATPRDTLNFLSERMTRGKFRHVPIMDHDRLVGIVSIGDVVKHRIESIEAEASAMRDYIATA